MGKEGVPMKVCEMCGSPPFEHYETGVSGDEIGYCNVCKDHAEFIEEDEDD